MSEQQQPVNDVEIQRLKVKVRALDRLETDAAKVRLEVGRELVRIRPRWPERGPNAKGWGEFLGSIGLAQPRAWELMKLAGYVDEQGFTADDETPSLRDAGARGEGEKAGNRDGWCTPAPIAKALPKKLDLDPCSNPRSLVKAKMTCSLEVGSNGLKVAWFGLTYVNGPYSDLMPWADKLEREITLPWRSRKLKGAGFLVNADNSPAWWHVLVRHLHLRLDFDERLEFIPPPGVEPSKNDRPQTLLMSPAFWKACDRRALLKLGTLWTKA